MPKVFNMALVSKKELTEKVMHFTFEIQDADSFYYIPGQFIRIFIPNETDKIVTRSYSLAHFNLPQPNHIEFAASYVESGVASEFLFKMKPGDVVKSSGPFGRLILKEDDNYKRIIFMATNTGVTPFRAMIPLLNDLLLNNPHQQIIVIEGVRHASDELYTADFLSLEKNYPERFKYIAALSREKPTLSHQREGYVQTQLDVLSPESGKDLFYLCGNPNMVDAVYTNLVDLGFDIKDIRREKYISN